MSKQRPEKILSATNKPASAVDDAEGLFIPYKVEILRWILSIVCSLIVYGVVALVVSKAYHPDIAALIEQSKQLFFEAGLVQPEPMETLLVHLAIVMVIPGMIGFYAYFLKNSTGRDIVRKPVFLYLSILCLFLLSAILFFDFISLNPFGPETINRPQNARDVESITNFDFYFKDVFMGSYFLLYALLIVPLMSGLFFIGFKKYKWDRNKLFNIISSVIGYSIILWAMVAIVGMNVYKLPYSNENKFDFNAVYYSMTQVYAGLPMLVSGFTNTYGLYPHFLNPLFQLTGLSVLRFSMVMSALIVVSFACNFYFLKHFVNNKLILLLGFCTIIFFPYLDFKLTNSFDSLFSLFPVRYIVPSILSVLTVLYLKKRTIPLYLLTFIVMAALILWNPEIGMVSYISWTAMNMYIDLYGPDGKINYRRMGMHIAVSIASAAIVFGVYEVLIYVCYGAWPSLSLLFGPILFFGKYGFNNLPMVLIHPWNINALVLILGFLYSLALLYKKEVTNRSAAVLLVSLIGLGYFMYFQGRSQNSNLALSSSYCFLLLIILGDELWSTVKRTNIFLLNALFIAFLLVISFSFIEIVYNSKKLVAMMYQEDDKLAHKDEQMLITANRAFIISKTKEKEKILIFSAKKRQALLYQYKRAAGFNPGFIDMLLQTDLVKLEHTIRDSSFKVFIEPVPGVYSFLNRPLAAFAATYEFDSYNEMVGLFVKRKTVIPADTFFAHTDRNVVYRKYTDDTAGRAQRITDAMGLDPVALQPEFSVQVLFFSKFQIFDPPTVIGNVKDSAGFVIGNVRNTPKYFFGLNALGYAIPTNYNEWCYCVMNVFPDHFDVYKNGQFIFVAPIARPMENSKGKLYIGNKDKGFHYFVGAIAEIALLNKTVDSIEIKHTWEKIKQATAK